MLFEKKYVTLEYIIKLIIGLLRYNQIEDNTVKQLSYIYKLYDYFKSKRDKFDIILQLYDTDDINYLKLFVAVLEIRNKYPLFSLEEIKQKVVDKFERSVDKVTFNKIYKVISYCIKIVNDDKYTNQSINDEYHKLLKFIILWKSCNKLNNLYNNFYSGHNSLDEFNLTISEIFEDYDVSIDNCDFLLDDAQSLDLAFNDIAANDEELRLSELFKSINFIQKTRIAIFLGESGFGKSMMLCHLACENLKTPKPGDKTYIVPYISFENSKEETLCRILANLFEEEIDIIRMNMRDEEIRKEYQKRYQKIVDKNTKLYIVKLPPRKHNMLSLEVYLNRALMRYKNAEIYTLYIDYIDKMLPNNYYSLNKPTHEKLDEISDEFKALVEKYDCAGVTVSQIGRSGIAKSRNKEDWGASDIRGAIAKFENADIVIPMKYDDTLDELGYIYMSFEIEKHRYGRKNVIIDAIYKPYFAKFYPVDDDSATKKIIKDNDKSDADIDIDIQEIDMEEDEDIKLKTSLF